MPRIKIAVAVALVITGFWIFRQRHDGMDLAMIIAGLVYLYIRWHAYKRQRDLERSKNN